MLAVSMPAVPQPRRWRIGYGLLVAFLFVLPASGQTRYALLVGIDTYQPPNTTDTRPAGADAGRFAPGAPLFENLAGPTHDVASMRALLTSSKFGFPDDSRHIHVLQNAEATRAGILAAMHTYLIEQPQKGDTVVFYYAGHGSLRVNTRSNKQAFDLGGKPTPLDNTIVPADAYLGTEDIRDREMARLFNQALDKGIHLVAIFDSCHSGGIARGAQVGPRMKARMLGYDPRDIAEAPDVNPDGTLVVAPEDRNDNAALVFSAAQVDQKAEELQDASPPHGIFTMALIDALQVLPSNIPANDLWKRVEADMEVGGVSDQRPVLDGPKQRREQPLFGGEGDNGRLRVAVVGVEDDAIILDTGKAADIGVGSEFVALAQSDKLQGDKPTLRITAEAGINRSIASLISPTGTRVAAKDIFEMTKWIPAEQPALNFWIPASHLTEPRILAAVREVRSTGVRLVNDPSREPWTWLIRWDGSQWALQKAGERAMQPLGSTLSAGVLKAKLQKGAVVWLDVPPSAELAGQLQMNDSHGAAKSTENEAEATYLLTGLVTSAGPVYAWYNRGDFVAGRQTPAGYGNGCSPDSPYPLRTDWVSGAATAGTLKNSARKLAELNGWLLLPQAKGSSDFPYHLALQHLPDHVVVEDKGFYQGGDNYGLVLQARGNTEVDARWIYVVLIDCQGTGQLVFPHYGGNNSYPMANGRLPQIPLPGFHITIGPPFGTDTYVLLSTATEISKPDALTFTGVVRGEAGSGQSPLAVLLGAAGSTRGDRGEMRTDWGVEYRQMHGQPAKTP